MRTPAMPACIFTRPLSWRSMFAWPVKPRAPTQVVEAEVGRSHSSRSNVAARRIIDPELFKRVETDAFEALWTAHSTRPTCHDEQFLTGLAPSRCPTLAAVGRIWPTLNSG
jgi:hypothetical protein